MPNPTPDSAPGFPEVSVICTVRDEVATIDGLIDSLLSGTRIPDEIVITDAGSTDGTRARLEAIAATNPRVRVLDVAGNRSLGRNAAIRAATSPVIACIDGGCVPEPDWLEELTAPFSGPAQWVGGFYRPGGETTRRVCIGLTMVFVLEEALAGGFFPSARSMAFTRDAWAAVGGFPEHLELSEDTAFDESMSAAGYEMVFRPRAVVTWYPPATFGGQFRVLWSWSRSDGESGIRTYAYRAMLRVVAAAGALGLAGWLIDRRLAVAGLIPLGVVMARQTRHKYRWAPDASKYLWLPAAWAVGFAARLGGFAAGRWARKRTGIARDGGE